MIVSAAVFERVTCLPTMPAVAFIGEQLPSNEITRWVIEGSVILV